MRATHSISYSYPLSGLPNFTLNDDVNTRTRAPPVQIAAAWVRQYPSAHSPLKGTANPLLNLSQGAPGYLPPRIFTDRIAREGSAGNPHAYTSGLGEPALREAVATNINEFYRTGGTLSAANVAITCGCNMAFAASIAAIASRGDSVILPYPWYFNHEMTLTAMGINVIPVPADQPDGTVDLEKIRAAMTDRVRAVVVVTPNNPRGTVYPAESLAAIYRICGESRVALVLDETYVSVANELSRVRH